MKFRVPVVTRLIRLKCVGLRLDRSGLNRRICHGGHGESTRRRVMEELSSLTVSQREQFLVENDVFGIYNYFDASDVSTQKYM